MSEKQYKSVNEKRSKNSYNDKWVKVEEINLAQSPQPFLLMCAPWVWWSTSCSKRQYCQSLLCLIVVQSLTWVKELHDTRTRSVSQSKPFENLRVYRLDKLTPNKRWFTNSTFFVAESAHLIRNFYSSRR